MINKINIHSSVAVYEQIENQVEFAIASGKLKAGDQLPGIKDLGDTLGVNFNTVVKAYRDLEVKGLIRTRRGLGCYIKEGVQSKCRKVCRERINKRLYEIVSEAKAAGIPKKVITDMASKSFAVEGDIYGDVPRSVKLLAK